MLAALASIATVFFSSYQFWSSSVRDQQSEWRTSTLEFQTAEAKKETAQLALEAEKARAQIADAQARAAEANQKAEAERLARIQLEVRLAPRMLVAEQQQRIISKLSSFHGSAVDIIICGTGSDIGPLSEAISAALERASWHVRKWSAMGGITATGILIQTADSSTAETEAAADGIVAALNSEGILSGRWDRFKGTDVPAPLTGPEWDANNVAQIRMLLSTKP